MCDSHVVMGSIHTASVGGGGTEDGTANESVLSLHKHVGHPVVFVFGRITEGPDTELVSNAATSGGSSSNHHPLHSSQLSAAEMASHTRAQHNHGGSTGSSEAHSESKIAPTTLSLEELVLV